MTARQSTTSAAELRPAWFWRCACGLGLIVKPRGKHVLFARAGRQYKRCPHCRRKLIDAFRETS